MEGGGTIINHPEVYRVGGRGQDERQGGEGKGEGKEGGGRGGIWEMRKPS